MITVRNADAALKDYYLDAVSAQLNEGISPFFAAIEKNADNVYGKDVKLAVVRGNSGNVMAGAEDGGLWVGRGLFADKLCQLEQAGLYKVRLECERFTQNISRCINDKMAIRLFDCLKELTVMCHRELRGKGTCNNKDIPVVKIAL